MKEVIKDTKEGARSQFEVAPYSVQGAGRREVSEVSLLLRLVLVSRSTNSWEKFIFN